MMRFCMGVAAVLLAAQALAEECVKPVYEAFGDVAVYDEAVNEYLRCESPDYQPGYVMSPPAPAKEAPESELGFGLAELKAAMATECAREIRPWAERTKAEMIGGWTDQRAYTTWIQENRARVSWWLRHNEHPLIAKHAEVLLEVCVQSVREELKAL
ncbi:hypothetical protein [Chitiniphilus eburneus]|uniref:Lysozyme inhibitor LprI N-terminal domain-containing protein n=1 Tax=Chitiniphilus eburneus TaxID=2571148 RepID=A0A4U0QC97_9NEIS|nr:hypothetical protein [Chitiniphilus eburneus]TJZ79051.1 hypothetical protein FAZ21_01845 [Chitiniphilus eburneus]